jgi:hypothetical protein
MSNTCIFFRSTKTPLSLSHLSICMFRVVVVFTKNATTTPKQTNIVILFLCLFYFILFYFLLLFSPISVQNFVELNIFVGK